MVRDATLPKKRVCLVENEKSAQIGRFLEDARDRFFRLPKVRRDKIRIALV
jgi:hypothetical protein